MNTKIGLRERIANAETENELIHLLTSGNDFKYASERTRLSWKHTAQRRMRQLQKTQPPVVDSTDSTDSTDSKNIKKKKSFTKHKSKKM